MSEWNKSLIANFFVIPDNENTEYTILIAIDTYGIDIDNPDVKFVIQWDIPLLFNPIIQRMSQARRKGRASAFIFFTSKWTKIKDIKEIEKRNAGLSFFTTVNAQLSNSN